VVFAATHVVTTSYRLLGGTWNSIRVLVVANGIMLIPGLTAILFVGWVFREPLLTTLGLRLSPNRWWLAAWLLPPVLMLATLGTSMIVPGTSYDTTMASLGDRMGFTSHDAELLRTQTEFFGLPPLAGFLAQGLLLGPTVGVIGGLGEELAWRGLLHHELIRGGFWRCSMITGILWGLWHVPLTLQGYGYPSHPFIGTLVFLVYALFFAPVLTFVRLRAGSVIAPAILHGTADATVLLTLALVRGGTDLTTGWGSLSCVAVLAIVDTAIAVAVARSRSPSRSQSAAEPARCSGRGPRLRSEPRR